jgi:hypothetical protein
MAVVRTLNPSTLEKYSRHTYADCTYSIVTDNQGQRYLQLDTYGSNTRKILGKKSQSIRFSQEAIVELKEILEKNFQD